MVLALSNWVMALWFHVSDVVYMVTSVPPAVVGAAGVIKAIFTKPKSELAVEGLVLDQSQSPRLWNELSTICAKVGTDRPDQVVMGIDDNFFVTEEPITVGETTCRGRTFYVSMSLLKQMCGAEADAVLAHEMAHFSGNDTLYSKKISPLLAAPTQPICKLCIRTRSPGRSFILCAAFADYFETFLERILPATRISRGPRCRRSDNCE